MSRMATQHIHVLLTQLHCNSDFQCLIRHVSDHGGVLDVTGSPGLVTLVPFMGLVHVCGIPLGSRMHTVGEEPSQTSTCQSRVPTGPGPRHSTQSIYNTRLSEVHTTHQYLL